MRGIPLQYPVRARDQYRAALDALIRAQQRDYRRGLRETFESFGQEALTQDANIGAQFRILFNRLGEYWGRVFADAATRLTDQMMARVDQHSKSSVRASLEELSGLVGLKVPKMPRQMAERVAAATAENVALIKSIGAQFHERIQSEVLTAVATGGRTAQQLYDYLDRTGEVSSKRAALIARDQVSKATTAINTERVKSAGVRKFEWVHSGGGAEPRELHVEYDGQIFEYDNPPVIDEKTGERGYPGQLINCRCTARPVLDFGEEIEDVAED